jgi:hypothetical protein
MDGWIKRNFGFQAPTAGVTFMKGGELPAARGEKAVC